MDDIEKACNRVGIAGPKARLKPIDYNTLTNEFGDRICFHRYSVVATNKETGNSEFVNSERSAKIWLNKQRKAKKWTSSME